MRTVAVVIAVLLQAQAIGPALFSAGDSSLPPCCRRNGKHHCAMDAAANGPVFRAPACPVFPRVSPPVTVAFHRILTGRSSQHGRVRIERLTLPAAEALHGIAFLEIRSERGPPTA